ncbi:hypothetical protein PT273_09075 [Orbaceae bacterium ESL0727]|nr:hypothetical protein [Orbaceae bacterium ESL0727]
MAIKWNKFPETEPQKDGPWIEPCLVVVKYESNNEKIRTIRYSYFSFDSDYGCETWDNVDMDDEIVTHWVYVKDIQLPNDSEEQENE